ncbi:MAG TPA: Ig-like domain-containing protein [Bacteroidota bacterium]|nr:Ig-like domain-containing protein [Bacteroidota bacterium]
MRTAGIIMLLLIAFSFLQAQDLSGLVLCIDPGHGGYDPANDRHVIPDPGTDFWESESNFRKALHLKALLEAKGATVLLTRNSNDEDPGLTARSAFANANNADWFHSIHSNATGNPVNTTTNSTLVLIKEDIPTRQPAFPPAVTMSGYVYNHIRSQLRTQASAGNIMPGVYLDYTFYGGPPPDPVGFNLGVLRELIMPGELSEGSFHDNFPETRRLMNSSYRKMEAYGIRDAFLQYYAAPADPLGMIAGIVKNGAGSPVNHVRFRLAETGVVFQGDGFNNGFYLFDNLPVGSYKVVFESPGFVKDSTTVTLAASETRFLDWTVQQFLYPAVVHSLPAQADSSIPAWSPLEITFSASMNTASVEAAFSIVPPANGTFDWFYNNSALRFTPDSLLVFDQSYSVSIDTSARSASGYQLDANGDGVPGDSFVLPFRAAPVDIIPPVVLSQFPMPNDTVLALNHIMTVRFNEPLDPTSVSSAPIGVQIVGGLGLPRSVQYWESSLGSGINVYVQGGLTPNRTYRVTISGVRDIAGNLLPGISSWDFSVSSSSYLYSPIENFGVDYASRWPSPLLSARTTGVQTALLSYSTATPLLVDGYQGAAHLSFKWDTTAVNWLLDLPYHSANPLMWDKRLARLQCYLYGDGGNTRFRFAVRDSLVVSPDSSVVEEEMSAWTPVDWIGWRLVEWDLERDSAAAGTGNGRIDGFLSLKGIQLQYQPGSSADSGMISLGPIQLAKDALTGVPATDDIIPAGFSLSQNFPNPFNPVTAISYQLPAKAGTALSKVQLSVFDVLGREVAVLVNEEKQAGTYSTTWNASSMPSGVYFYTLVTPEYRASKKMILVK